MIYQVREPALARGFQLPEGPRWHGGRLWFADVRAGRYFAIAEGGAPELLAELDEPCSGSAFLPDGTPLLALMRSSRIVRVGPDGAVAPHADLSALAGTSLNDMVGDARGRCYANRLAYPVQWAPPEDLGDGARRIAFAIPPAPETLTDAIALVEPDGASRIVADGLLGPNGTAISADGRRLVVAEWRARRITTFAVDPSDGSLRDRRTLCVLEGGVDGLCLDEQGCVWCASPAANQCVRISPAGEILDRALPREGTHVMACVLGGADRRTLYLMTNRRPEPTSGRLEGVRVGVAGAGNP